MQIMTAAGLLLLPAFVGSRFRSSASQHTPNFSGANTSPAASEQTSFHSFFLVSCNSYRPLA